MPVNVSGLEHLACQMLVLYEVAERAILKKMSRHLRSGKFNDNWLNIKNADVNVVNKEVRTVLEQLKSDRQEMSDSFIKGAWESSSKAFVKEASHFNDLRDIKPLPSTLPVVAVIIAELNERLNAVDNNIIHTCNTAYQTIIGNVYMNVRAEPTAYLQAEQYEIDRFAKKGVSGFTDTDGHKWEMSTYAELATISAIERASIEGYTETMQEYGYDLAIISSHGGACPLCEAWEDVIVSVSGGNTDYPSLDEAEESGCFHPRCIHDISTYYEGVTRTGKNHPDDVGEPSIAYTSRQQQRGLERKIREWKRREAAAINPQSEHIAHNHVVQYQQKIRSLVKNYDQPNDRLIRNYEREGGTQRTNAK